MTPDASTPARKSQAPPSRLLPTLNQYWEHVSSESIEQVNPHIHYDHSLHERVKLSHTHLFFHVARQWDGDPCEVWQVLPGRPERVCEMARV